jgi:two-component system NtrC family sensor kinase
MNGLPRLNASSLGSTPKRVRIGAFGLLPRLEKSAILRLLCLQKGIRREIIQWGLDMAGEKILVIDDRRENLLFLADSVLRPEGYDVITAMDGKQGLDKALAEKPDLIITDLKMPRLSGLELMAALRKENSSTPVILTTFYGSEQAAIEAFRLGARDYIIKPYEIKDMLDSVERALIERRLLRETVDLQEGQEVRQHLEERVRQLHSLCGIGKALFALHDSDEAMRLVVEAAIYMTEAGTSQLFLLNPQTQQLEIRAVRGPSDSRAVSVRQSTADRSTMRAFQTGKAVSSERSAGGRDSVVRLAVPLRTDQKPIGVLGIDAKPAHSFSENDKYMMSMLSDFGAVALMNCQSIAGMKDQLASVAERRGSTTQDTAADGLISDLTESIGEAERISRELRNLAAAAQILAAKLQVSGRTG